ncbi:Uncharacterized protein OBRU01_25210, partial [Operophtera brumata]
MADDTRAIGNIKEFNLSTDTWNSYIKRVRAFFLVNGTKAEVQTAFLITLVGNETYDLMTVLCSPDEPEKKTFDKLVEIVENHLNPKASDMAERMKLRACLQNQSETVNEYLLRLKRLAMTCKFKGQESLEENLRDQFTYGLRSEKYRQRLLTERELSRPLIESDKVLTVYSGEKIKPIGTMPVNVVNNDQLFTSKLYVIDNGNCPPILGRKWMRELKVSLPIVAHVSCEKNDLVINEIMRKYKNVFEPGIGTFNRGTISLQYDDERHRRHIDQIFKLPNVGVKNYTHSLDPLFDEGDTVISDDEGMASSGTPNGHTRSVCRSSDGATPTPPSTTLMKTATSSPNEGSEDQVDDMTQEMVSLPAQLRKKDETVRHCRGRKSGAIEHIPSRG